MKNGSYGSVAHLENRRRKREKKAKGAKVV